MGFLPEVRLEDADLMFMCFDKNIFTHFEFFSADSIDLFFFFHILPTQCIEYLIVQVISDPIIWLI